MLILTRHPKQKIIIGDGIEVIFLGMKDGKARIGFNAPNNITIHREEVYKKIQMKESK